MGLDIYLGRYRKANLEKTKFNLEESKELQDWDGVYSVFDKCPNALKGIATEVQVVNEYYDMKKISNDFANGEPLTIGMIGGGKIGFSNYEKHINIDLDADIILKNYILQKEETNYVVQGHYEVAYWRKANQIRQWFINHIDEFDENDNGEYHKVTKELLEDLIDDCRAVLNNHDLADELLPTSSGFFFGSTEYNEWYFKDLENTIEQCERVIKETSWIEEVVVYHDSW